MWSELIPKEKILIWKKYAQPYWYLFY
jgi:hypothetical protein